MARQFSRSSYRSVSFPCVEKPPQQPSPEELRAVREAELRAATREYEAELLAMFDRLPKWTTTEEGTVHHPYLRHHYWDGQKWVEFDVKKPPLWVVETLDVDHLPPPGESAP